MLYCSLLELNWETNREISYFCIVAHRYPRYQSFHKSSTRFHGDGSCDRTGIELVDQGSSCHVTARMIRTLGRHEVCSQLKKQAGCRTTKFLLMCKTIFHFCFQSQPKFLLNFNRRFEGESSHFLSCH